jgi:GT2 family glycosyltransferase
MTDEPRPCSGPSGAAEAAAGRARRGLVLLADLAPPASAPLARCLAGLGAHVIDLDEGMRGEVAFDHAASQLAADLSALARQARRLPTVGERLVAQARSLLAPRLEAEAGSRLLLSGSLIFDALDFFLALAGAPDHGAFILAGEPVSAIASRNDAPARAGRCVAHAERRWREALRRLEGACVYVVPDASHLDAATVTGLSCFLGLDPPGAVDEPNAPRTSSALASEGGLFCLVESLAGPHLCLSRIELPPESLLCAALAEAEAEARQLAGALAWTARQLEPFLRLEAPKEPGDPSSVELAGGTPPQASEERPYPLNASEDRVAYHEWLAARRRPSRLALEGPVVPATSPPSRLSTPVVSVIVPVHRTPLWALERCVASVLAQDMAAWQLCICDDGSNDPALSERLASYAALDPRVEVTALDVPRGISAATNEALRLARGELVAFLDHDDELAPHALRLFAEALQAEPEADVLYCDEDKLDALGERFDPFFKPAWSPDLLLSYAYLAHLMAVRRQLVEELGGLRSAFDGSQDWDLALRATERARRVVHIPDVLYHWRSLPGSTSAGSGAKPWAFEAGRRVLEDALSRRGGGEVIQSARFPGRYHLRRALGSHPLVSIVIPFRDEPALLATCATSLRLAPGYDRFELVLVDNGSELPETAELLDRLSSEPNVRIIEDPGPFNWAAINNAASKKASGELLLFANNDIEARVSNWLSPMVAHALRPEVGAVGARLLYPDGTIQHAGVVIGLGGIAGHVLRGLPAEMPGYASMAIQTRNCSVVTGACMMVRRDVFESVGGFDEELAVAFNDVDFCLRLREKGYLVVYEPLAELVHHESRSRGHTDDLAEGKRIVERWSAVIAAGDPYLNPNLSHWRYWCPLSTAQEDYRWKTYLERSLSTPRSSSST